MYSVFVIKNFIVGFFLWANEQPFLVMASHISNVQLRMRKEGRKYFI